MVGIGNKELIKRIGAHTPKGYCDENDIGVSEAKGSWFTDMNGNKILDFTSGIFTNSFGHCFEPLINAEIKAAQTCDNVHGRRTLSECLFYERLARLMPKDDYKFIPYNDGGYTVDRGLSDIVNYYNKKRIPIAAFRGGFHGKTMGAKLTINETASAALFQNFQLNYPNCYRCPLKECKQSCKLTCLKALKEELKQRKAKAIIFEPVQGAGVIIPPKPFMEGMAEFCEKNKIVMFADEVLTGGGRTGYFLASTGLYNVIPDVISITKGLANGRPFSVLCEREYITDNPYAKRKGERSSTFAAHPINMAVAAEVLNQLKAENIFNNVKRRGAELAEAFERFSPLCPYIGDVRSVGLMGAVEFVKDQSSKEPFSEFAAKVYKNCRKNGVEVILSGHILRLAPPLNITTSELSRGLYLLAKSIKQVMEE